MRATGRNARPLQRAGYYFSNLSMSAPDALSSGLGAPSSQLDGTSSTVQVKAGHQVDEYDRPVSPLHLLPGQIDGLKSLQAERFANDRGHSPTRRQTNSTSLHHLEIRGAPSPATLALAAMQYLPYPLMVLGSQKTVILANGALGRLLGIEDE
jgi:hypothetical protein